MNNWPESVTSQAFFSEGASNGEFGKSESLATEANGVAISEITEVAGLSTGTIVGLTMRRDEATYAISALQIDSKHKPDIAITP